VEGPEVGPAVAGRLWQADVGARVDGITGYAVEAADHVTGKGVDRRPVRREGDARPLGGVLHEHDAPAHHEPVRAARQVFRLIVMEHERHRPMLRHYPVDLPVLRRPYRAANVASGATHRSAQAVIASTTSCRSSPFAVRWYSMRTGVSWNTRRS